jgi:site-specific recombinase XerC
MEDVMIDNIIQKALTILEKDVGLAQSSLTVTTSRCFKPITDFFAARNELYYNEKLICELEDCYRENLQIEAISQNVYNLRTRGTRILREVYETGTYSWKGPVSKVILALPENYEQIIAGMIDANLSEGRNCNTLSIVRRFLRTLSDSGINDIAQVEAEQVQTFLDNISQTRSKSMDDVISSLRKLNCYLVDSGMLGLPYVGLLMAPRARERKIYPCMSQDDLNVIIKAIDRSTAIGKRDYAILLLAVSSGLRAGDIASIKLSDIDWRKKEIHLFQGKTSKSLDLPLQKGVGAAIADYILNGRTESESHRIFLRSLAPFQGFKDGVSVACILRRRMAAAGVLHEIGDGKTMHGIRRMLGTEMTVAGVDGTTVAQVLGHKTEDANRPYVALDIEGLRECALGFDSLEGDSR